MTGAVTRKATSDDIEALLRIEERCFDTDRISRRSFRALIARPTAETIVAKEGEAIVGYAMILFRKGTALARLYSIAVDPDAKSRGIGTLLLNAAEQAAFDHDRLLLRLEVREDNERAIALYKRHGYRPIGRWLDYYADHSNALRFEKTLRGGVPLTTSVPYYEQTTDFTCGSACLMMALANHLPKVRLDPVLEIRLWREATTVFMQSGLGGCEPFGLAVAAHEHGLKASIMVSTDELLFLQSVRDPEKRMVMELAQTDFRRRAKAFGIKVRHRGFTMDDIRSALKRGAFAIVLVSGYHMFGKKVPHWVLAHGEDGRHIMIHDPWVEDDVGETVADAANVPIPYAIFDRMARFGASGLRAAVFLEKRTD
ncbi:GNAT family N-acetyltransferase/peptidase C39 family protein [Mesorhizobium sp. RMAD-H1]|uniref:GNAT family N-acetyltransferase/peptidase C39 family protein n=1 Tax=Mesorhizobium sp. RMAD-H1 TaxID=2587065 RepID=UPI00161C5D98|nr:GNAT family N-acetyltransferase/peptidase C39 family protein [Mesorhizobium sp. RMAD-H1]MBB2972314.1 ribosomal-protein-alanine acetyltransferase [Mesorhizobium sp. RMAD-H1]